MAKLSGCKPWSTACTSAKYEDIYILMQRLFLSRPLRTAAVIVGRRPSASSDGDATTTTTSFSSKMTMWHYCPTYCLLLLFFLPPPRFARPPLAAQPASPFLFLSCASLLLFFFAIISSFRHLAIHQKNCQELFFFIIPPTFPSSLVGFHCSFSIPNSQRPRSLNR